MRLTGLLGFAIGLVATCSVQAASAQEICVVCSEPATTYRCQVKGSEKLQGVNRAERAVRFACVRGIARLGRHGSCRAGPTTGAACEGRAVMLEASHLLAVPPAPNRTAIPPEKTGPEPSKRGNAPPRTVKELAKNTLEDSKKSLQGAGKTVTEGAKKAGRAVGGVMQRSWDCVTSLFRKC